MKAKKQNSLAFDLMDDLLEDDQEAASNASSEQENSDKDLSLDATQVSHQPASKASLDSDEEEGSFAFNPEDYPETKFSGDDDLLDLNLDSDSNSGADIVNYLEEPPQTPPVEATEYDGDDATHKLTKVENPFAKKPFAVSDKTAVINEETARAEKGSHSQQADDKVRSSVGRFASVHGSGMNASASAAMAQSENLRIAQARILDLESEIERIRQENEQLAAAGETLRKRADEHAAKFESVIAKADRDRENHIQEKELLSQNLEARGKEVESLQLKIDELEMRLSTNIQKIRVRERELENRLELVKMESQAVVRSKDEIILDLKRQLDQLNLELDNYRSKGHDLNKQLSDKQEMLRRTVKALRIALSMLEGDEEIVKPLKKAK